MFAIIETGGKQYIVEPGQKIKIEKLNSPEKEKFIFDKVLLVSDKDIKVGAPYVKGAKVEAEIVRNFRARKVIVFRYHNKTRYRKTKGHRHHYSEVEIKKIVSSK